MSSPDGLTRRGVLFAPLGLAACGFAPAYAPGGPGAALRGRIALEAPDTPDGYRLRARLEDRLGRAAAPAATLAVALEVEEAPAVTDDEGTLRARIAGRAGWRLLSPAGAVLAEGVESGFTGADEGPDLTAGRAAAEEARERLMVLLADRIVARLLLLPAEALP